MEAMMKAMTNLMLSRTTKMLLSQKTLPLQTRTPDSIDEILMSDIFDDLSLPDDESHDGSHDESHDEFDAVENDENATFTENSTTTNTDTKI
ncbi:hypothetical protein ACA910_018166 [Epithemia clementina (nom. ined.)]